MSSQTPTCAQLKRRAEVRMTKVGVLLFIFLLVMSNHQRLLECLSKCMLCDFF